MLIYDIAFNGTTAAGAYSANTPKLVSGILKQIIIEFTTAGVTFDLAITDDKNLTVFKTETTATSKWRQEMNIPLKGIHTVAISGASANEAFTGKLMFQEVN